MTNEPFTATIYDIQDRQVSCYGISLAEGKTFDAFFKNDVASRLNDSEGTKEFEVHLRSLASTGFAQENLELILNAAVPEERSWAIGEALAEAYLSQQHSIVWPWNTERDKKNPKSSLPGADLIGFEINNGKIHLALGEVKTSTDKKSPPNVMYGRSGMTHQIDNIANNLGLINQLLKWLMFRCKGTKHETHFNNAIALFLDSGNKAVSLFGVLIRDTAPNNLDLKNRGKVLANAIQEPTTCQLLAVYIPCSIENLLERISGGEQ